MTRKNNIESEKRKETQVITKNEDIERWRRKKNDKSRIRQSKGWKLTRKGELIRDKKERRINRNEDKGKKQR